MGCVTSKPRNQHPNIFNVMNVNDSGQVISPGQLEVTETELILHQKGKEPTRWPLSFLRKYGCDSELFTFECGRRCPTGQGIYAFRCRKAEQLFNMLQHNLNANNVASLLPNANGSAPPEPNFSTGPPVHRRVSSQPEGYLNPVNNQVVVTRAYPPALSRPGSMNSSNGPISPSTTSPPPSANDISLTEHNNNKRGSLIPEHEYTNASVMAEALPSAPYMNLSAMPSPTLPASELYVNIPADISQQHLYMNVNTSVSAKEQMVPNFETDRERPMSESEMDERHCYANIGPSDIECPGPILSTSIESVPQTPTTSTPGKDLNYIVLELNESTSSAKATLQPKVDSPAMGKKSYVTIDFVKSNALSQSINNRMELEEGSRKTRHNSSIESSSTKQRCSLSD